MTKLTLNKISKMGINSLPMYGTYSRLNITFSATLAEVEQAARMKLRSGHEAPDALKFYAIMKRWHEHRQAGKII